MEWKRARRHDQKEKRVNDIFEAAGRLYKTHSSEQITLSLIAKEAGFTRSNLYKYFSSKEEIFLEMLKYDIEAWRYSVGNYFSCVTELSIEDFSRQWSLILAKHQRLLDLLPLSYILFERYASLDRLIDYKRKVMIEMTFLIEILSRLLPNMTNEKAIDFIYFQTAVAGGLHPMATFNEEQKRILEENQVYVHHLNFVEANTKAIYFYLKGLLMK